MNIEPQEAPQQNPIDYFVPWSARDTWISVLVSISVTIGLVVLVNFLPIAKIAETYGVAVLEAIYLTPALFILIWRRANWRTLGFRKFQWQGMALGCGLLVSAYAVVFLHNLVLTMLGIHTQGDSILRIFEKLKSPVWLFVAGIVIAPLVEESFFRGVLFQGFRPKYGWIKAALLSSFIFAVSHLDPTAIIPTFVLGFAIAVTYHKSNSIWPGMILHALVNLLGLLSAYAFSQLPDLIR